MTGVNERSERYVRDMVANEGNEMNHCVEMMKRSESRRRGGE